MALVEPVDSEDVDFGHAVPLADLNRAVWVRNQGFLSVHPEGFSVNLIGRIRTHLKFQGNVLVPAHRP